MTDEEVHDICQNRLERAYEKIQSELEAEKEFIEKMFTLQRFYLNSKGTPLLGRIRNFEALEVVLSASIDELSVSFDGWLQTILDLSDLTENQC